MLNFLKKSSNKQTDSHRLNSFSGVTKPVTGVEGWRGGGEEWKGEGGGEDNFFLLYHYFRLYT